MANKKRFDGTVCSFVCSVFKNYPVGCIFCIYIRHADGCNPVRAVQFRVLKSMLAFANKRTHWWFRWRVPLDWLLQSSALNRIPPKTSKPPRKVTVPVLDWHVQLYSWVTLRCYAVFSNRQLCWRYASSLHYSVQLPAVLSRANSAQKSCPKPSTYSLCSTFFESRPSTHHCALLLSFFAFMLFM